MIPLVWLSRDAHPDWLVPGFRRSCAKLCARLYAPHVVHVLAHAGLRVVVPRVTADALQVFCMEQLGQALFKVAEVEHHDAAAHGTGELWGLLPKAGEMLDQLAVRDALLSRQSDPQQTSCPANAWGRFPAHSESLQRAYYRARVNDILHGACAGAMLVRQCGMPEA